MKYWILLLLFALCCSLTIVEIVEAVPSVVCELSYISYDDDYTDFRIPYTTNCGNRIRPVITITFSGPATYPFETSGWDSSDTFRYPWIEQYFILLATRMSFVNTDTNQLFFPSITYQYYNDARVYRAVERSIGTMLFGNGEPFVLQFEADYFFSGTWNISYVATPLMSPFNSPVNVYINYEILPSFSCVVKANKTMLVAVSDPVVGQQPTSISQYNILMFSNPVKRCGASTSDKGRLSGTDLGYPFADNFTAVDPDAQGYATAWYTITNTTRIVAGMCGISPMNACDRTGTQAVMGFPYKTTMYSQPAIISSGNCAAGTYDNALTGWPYFSYGNSFISLDDPTKLHALRRLPFVLNRTAVSDPYRTNMAISPFTGVGALPSVTHAVTGISDSTTCWNYSTIGFNKIDGIAYNSSIAVDDDLPKSDSFVNFHSYIVSAKKYINFNGTAYNTYINITSPMRDGDSPPMQVFAIRGGSYVPLAYTVTPISPPVLWYGSFDGNSLFVNDQQIYAFVTSFYYVTAEHYYTYSIPAPITLYNTSLVSIYNVSIVTYSEIRFFCTWCDVDPILSYSVNTGVISVQCERTANLIYNGNFGTYLSFTFGTNECQNRSLVIASVGTNAYHTSYRIPQLQPSIAVVQVYTTYLTVASFKGGRVLSAACLNCQTDPVTGVNTTFWSLTCNGTSVTSITFRSLELSAMQFDVVGCTQLQNLVLTVRDGAYHTALAASVAQYNFPVELTYDFGLTEAHLLDNTYLILQFNNTGILDSPNFNLSRVTLTCYNLTATLGSPINSYGYNNQTRISILGNCNNVTAGGVSLTLQNGAVSDLISLSVNAFTGPLSISSTLIPLILSSTCIPEFGNTSNVTLLTKSSGFNLVSCQSCPGYGPVSSCNWKNPSNITFVYTGRDQACVNITAVSTQLANTVLNQVYVFASCPFVSLIDAVYTPFTIKQTRLKFDEYSIVDSSVIQSQINFSCGGVPFPNVTYAGVSDVYMLFAMNRTCDPSLEFRVSIAAYAFRTVSGLQIGPFPNYPVLTDRTSVVLSSCVPGNEISTEFLTVNLSRGVVLTGAAVAPPCTETNHTADGQTFYLPGKYPMLCQLNYGFCNQYGDKYNQSLTVSSCPVDKSIVQVNYTCTPNSTTSSLLKSYFVGQWSYASILQTQGNCTNPRISRYSPPEIETVIGGTTDINQFCTITYVILNAVDQLVLFTANYTICPKESREPDFNELSLGMVLLMSFLTIALLTVYYLYRGPNAPSALIIGKDENGYEQVIELE